MKKSVLVTGVSSGIGRGIAKKFLDNGYVLYGTFCSNKAGASELIDKYGGERVKLFGPFDFTDTAQTSALLIELKKIKFDAVVCNAGTFSENDDFNNFDLNEFCKTMNCNFYTPMMISIGLKDNIVDGGSIVIVSSNDAYPGAFSSMSYSISKSALISLMKCLCVNFGKKLVRVNSVAPGAIDTPMNTPEQMEISPYFTPVARVGTPEDVANVVYFLSSEDASFVNGENITIDGGYNDVSILLKSEADKTLSDMLINFINDPEFVQVMQKYLSEKNNDN